MTSPRQSHKMEELGTAADICVSRITVSLDGVTTIRTVGQKLTTTTIHRFLKIDLISPDILKLVGTTLTKGSSYKIPFEFTLPHQLDSTACTHDTVSTTVTDKHLLPPPTVGKDWDRGDMSPGVVEVEYGINACVTSTPSLNTAHSQDSTTKRTIRFIPRLSESPPLHVSLTNPRYKLRDTKSLRSNPLKRPFGTISAAAMQPDPLHLGAYGIVIKPTFIGVALTFNPEVQGITPPKLDSTSLSLQSYTWHQADPYRAFPDQDEKPSLQLPFTATIALAVDCPQISWARHDNLRLEDKNTGNSSAEFYSSTLQVPLSVSIGNKTILPAFHSCLISRTYDVRLRLGFKKGDLTIVAPLQIIADP